MGTTHEPCTTSIQTTVSQRRAQRRRREASQAREHYAGELHAIAVRRLAARNVRGDDALDVAQRIALGFAVDPAGVMGAYPQPGAFVAVSLAQRLIDHRKTDSRQRGQGWSRRRSDGSHSSSRQVVAIVVADPETGEERERLEGRQVHDAVVAAARAEDALFDRLDLDPVMDGMPAEDRWALFQVDVVGRATGEVAAELGHRREWLSRRLTAVRRRLAADLTAAGYVSAA
ncbi:hypothetical protein [Rhabdothermincola salaria]|uniref:hypothetical protein n=1 Tax=Rhabdothermincola salaria TaxID=2903142 RepID=UPI001E55E202|nr:hypothetical protein [Rhabdothermincola salaria]MCD9625282.1 hypothetical protein [Rhabdothermincola salaria]